MRFAFSDLRIDSNRSAPQRCSTSECPADGGGRVSVRNLSHELHPSALEYAGLTAMLQARCADIERHHHVTVAFNPADGLDSLNPRRNALPVPRRSGSLEQRRPARSRALDLRQLEDDR